MKIIRVVHSVKDAKINPYSEDINNIINQISYTEKCYEIIRNSRCERFILPATEEMPIDMKLDFSINQRNIQKNLYQLF